MRIRKCRQKLICAIKTFLAFLISFLIIFHTKDETIKSERIYETDTNELLQNVESRPWYFKNGTIRPEKNSSSAKGLKLWPNEADDDRILDQLMFIPKVETQTVKKIFLEQTTKTFLKRNFPNGSEIFEKFNCPVKKCEIVFDFERADAIVFDNYITRIREKSTFNQIWILHSLESPFFSGQVIQQWAVNWTASYRMDSDLVTPYEKWVYYDEIGGGDGDGRRRKRKNYAEGRRGKVAWFVSNCNSKNKRLEYAKSLAKYISVDIYGNCGDKFCYKDKERQCRKLISDNYKFYLSFENSNCRHYITEKFYSNALRLNVVPIVMGAPKEDYEKVAPKNSFIHVEDFESPKHLADYLHFLDKNDDYYNLYFSWKGEGEFINTFFFCRLCAMLHANRSNYHYKRITHWWRNKQICTKTFWNETNGPKIIQFLKNYKKITKNNF